MHTHLSGTLGIYILFEDLISFFTGGVYISFLVFRDSST